MAAEAVVVEELSSLAREASGRAYCPYSGFPVGAALISRAGVFHTGCNVENASFGLTNCAERTAIFSMVAAGETAFDAIVIYTPTEEPTAPCGACRQVLFEFNPNAEVIAICKGGQRRETTVRDLLPGAFGPKDLP